MAKVNTGGCGAAQVTPDFSDDEVFDHDRVWRPLRSNGLTSEVAPQTLHVVPLEVEHDLETNKSASSTSSLSGTRHTSLDADDRVWPNSVQNITTNDNNIRPDGLCSEVSKSESSHQRAGSAERASFGSAALLYRRQQLQLDRKQSIVDGLLFEIYDRWHGHRADSFDSDTFTECSSTSEFFHGRWDSSYETAAEQRHERQYSRSFLENQNVGQLRRVVHDMQRSISQTSGRLVRQLKRRDRQLARLARHCDVVTAILQAASLKRQIDTRMKFSVTPAPGQSAFEQWKDAMKAVNRLPMGLPSEFRKKVWLSLADHYIRKLKIDWHKTVRLAFNERSNPDDDKLGMQIVKDLHRTGCSSFSGQDNEEDRAVLKRVLLAYARWNKRIGYCQGFNVIAALLLNVMERKEDDALKVMIYLIDHVLPESYFDNNLRALSVDMAVFRDLLRLTLPTLSRHLDRLQHAAQDINTGACYEPPLTNVFTMQWFLTLFATCLPKEVVLRVWDAILLEGSEVLLRTALCLWGKLARRIMKVDSADEFYSVMGELSSHMMEGTVFNSDDMIKAIYAIAPFPFPQLTELREKYTYNIRPFSSNPAPGRKASRMAKAVLYSDEDEVDEEEMRAITSFPGMAPVQAGRGKGTDISVVGPGAYGADPELVSGSRDSVYMERMSTDITALKMQYDKLRQRQRQAHVIIAGAASAKKAVEVKPKAQAPVLVPKIETPLAMNHLFVGKVQGGRNRLVTHGPRIAASPSSHSLTQKLEAVAAAQAASRGRGSPAKPSPAAPAEHRDRDSDRALQACPVTGEHGEEEKAQDCLPEDCTANTAAERWEEAPTAAGQDLAGGSPGADMDSDCGGVKDGACEQDSQQSQSCVTFTQGDLPCIELSVEQTASPCETDEVHDKDCSQDERVCPVLSRQQSEEEGDARFTSISLEPDSSGSIELCHIKSLEVETGEQDSGIVLSSSSLEGSGESSPVKKPQRPVSIELQIEGPAHGHGPLHHHWQEGEGLHENSCYFQKPAGSMGRSNSAPIGSSSSQMTLLSVLAPATTPTHSQRSSPSTITPSPATVSPLSPSSSSHSALLSSSPLKSSSRPFNPFPVKHVNTNRARTGLKLGLYTPSTLEHIQGQLLGGLLPRKARNASS